MLQRRALLTYINRIYYPFMVRDPELGSAEGHLWALWVHSLANATPLSSIQLGSALVLPSLEHLPDALAATEASISHSGRSLPSRELPHKAMWRPAPGIVLMKLETGKTWYNSQGLMLLLSADLA